MPKKQSYTIEVYDEDAVLRESIGGPMDFDDVRATMESILRNDGIPVIRQLGKHAAATSSVSASAASSLGEGAIDGKHAAKPQPWEQPMCLHIKYDGVEFSATGRYEDVMDAQAEFLRAIFEE